MIAIFPKLLDLEPTRRDALLNAAIKEFAIKGYDDASTNVIAKEAGISKALMFHYVNSKKDLFLFLCEYCGKIVKEGYYDLLDFTEKDLLKRLRQSYMLQVELLQKYPWILEFTQIIKDEASEEVHEALEPIRQEPACLGTMFDGINETKFRQGLDIETCKKLIYWANVGFTNDILNDIRNCNRSELDYEKIATELDVYLNELEKSFYR